MSNVRELVLHIVHLTDGPEAPFFKRLQEIEASTQAAGIQAPGCLVMRQRCLASHVELFSYIPFGYSIPEKGLLFEGRFRMEDGVLPAEVEMYCAVQIDQASCHIGVIREFLLEAEDLGELGLTGPRQCEWSLQFPTRGAPVVRLSVVHSRFESLDLSEGKSKEAILDYVRKARNDQGFDWN